MPTVFLKSEDSTEGIEDQEIEMEPNEQSIIQFLNFILIML